MDNHVRHLVTDEIALTANANSRVIPPLGTRRVWVTPSATTYLAYGRAATGTARFTLAANQTSIVPSGGYASLNLLSGSNSTVRLTYYGGRQTTGARILGGTLYHSATTAAVYTLDVPQQATHAIVVNDQPVRYTTDSQTDPTTTVGNFLGTQSGRTLQRIYVAPHNQLRIARATNNTTNMVIQLQGDIGYGNDVLRPVGTLFTRTVTNSAAEFEVIAPGKAKYARARTSRQLKYAYGEVTPTGAGKGAFLPSGVDEYIPVNAGTKLTFRPSSAGSYTINIQFYSFGFGS